MTSGLNRFGERDSPTMVVNDHLRKTSTTIEDNDDDDDVCCNVGFVAPVGNGCWIWMSGAVADTLSCLPRGDIIALINANMLSLAGFFCSLLGC